MKKALPWVFFALVLCPILSTSTAFANDGNTGRPAPHKQYNPEYNHPRVTEGGGSWLSDLWNDILGLFGHHKKTFESPSHGEGKPANPPTGNPASGGTVPPAGGPSPAAPAAPVTPAAPGSPSVPVDGGICFLLAAGVAFGVKKMADSYKGV
jgi:hypothetical protein